MYGGVYICEVQHNKLTPPIGTDDEKEWEQFEERYSEWKDAIKRDLIPKCEQHFNNNKK